MNILNQLTIKSLLLNKKRTIVTIVGIILSCALITGVVTLVSSFQNSLTEYARRESGDYHAIFYNVPKDEQKYIINNVNVSKYMLSQNMGYSTFKESQNEYKPYFYLIGFNENSFNNRGLNLVEGRYPINSDEIVLSEHIEDNNVKYNIGDKIKLNISDRIRDNEKLDQSNPYYASNLDNKNEMDQIIGTEQLAGIYTKEYTIVGKIKRPSFEPYSAPGYTLITYLDENNSSDKLDIAVTVKNPKNIYNFIESIVGKEDTEEGIKYNYKTNNELLRFQGVSKNDSINTAMFIVSTILIAIIMVSSIMVIRNSFSISITERVKQLGILSSIGATSKQIKKNILYEGFILSAIAIPIGITTGILAIKIVLLVVNNILGKYINNYLNEISLNLYISFESIVLSIIIALVTIFISSFIPAIRASKIAPIESIRASNDIKINKKKLKVSKLYTKLFGIEGEISLKNLKRSKKKYRTTISSILLSIVIFISLNSFINYALKMSNLYYENVGYNINVTADYNNLEGSIELFNEITNLNNINNYSILKSKIVMIDSNYYLSDKSKEIFYYDQDEKASVEIIALGEKEYENYIKKVGGNIDDYKDKGILVDKNIITRNNKKYEFNFLNKDITNIKFNTYYSNDFIKDENSDQIGSITTVYDEKEYNIDIAKKTDIVPLGISQSSNIVRTAYIIVSDEYIKRFDFNVEGMYIDSSNATQLQKDIEEMDIKINSTIYNQEDYVRENNAMILVVSIFCYGFISVISLIGITNIFNTITTNMELRKGEFAVLKSIGMTDKEFRKMINLESLFYGLKSLLFGIPIGIILSYLIYLGFKEAYSYDYILPYQSVIISVIFVFVIIFSTMNYSTKKLKNQNIIDTIRNENI